MRSSSRLLIVAVLVGCSLALVARMAWAANQAESKKAAELAQQRLEIATEAHAAARELIVGGKLTTSQMLDAQADLLDAKLAVAKTVEERIKAYEEVIEFANKLTQDIKTKAQGGVASIYDALSAESQLLKFRASLERLRAE